MTLPIDLRRSIRTLAQQQQLVEAIFAAPASEQETEWLEWKTDVDLGVKDWQGTISRFVLGFANRDPDAAAQWSEGCAYIVLGVAPGTLHGTSVHDIVKIDAWLSAYLGTAPDAPAWSATYVQVGEAPVLIITVEPPRWGDPIWTLRKEYKGPNQPQPTRAGTVFVRRRGSTDQADPREILMLSQRAGAGPRRLRLSLTAEPDDKGAPIDTSAEVVAWWTEAERSALAPPPPIPAPPPRPSDSLRTPVTIRDFLEVLQPQLDAAVQNSMGDRRTREQFDRQVEEYIAKGQETLAPTLIRRAIRQNTGRLRLWLENKTDHNFSQVLVELHFEQHAVKTYFDESDVEGDDMPSRPGVFGSLKRQGLFSSFSVPNYRLPYSPSVFPARRGSIDNSGSSRISFPPVDVRPGYSHRLETLYLLVSPEYGGQTIEGTWVATASDASGMDKGALRISIAAEGPSPGVLLQEPSSDDADD